MTSRRPLGGCCSQGCKVDPKCGQGPVSYLISVSPKVFCTSYKHPPSVRFSEALSPSSAKRKSNHPTLIFVRPLSLSIRFNQSLQNYFFPLIGQIYQLAPLLKGTFLCTVIDSNCCKFFDAFIKRPVGRLGKKKP